VVLSGEEIGYSGIESPKVVLALAQEGVNRKKSIFGTLADSVRVFKAKEVDLPATAADVVEVDFKELGIRPPDRALASLALMAGENRVLSVEMLEEAIKTRFKGEVLEKALALVRNQIR
jgi:hypothetical protein